MPPAPPAALQLASRLKQLRQQSSRLTQEKLADAFSDEESLSSVTVSSWESLKSPKLPPGASDSRLRSIFRYASIELSKQPKLFSLDELTPDEKKAYERLEAELLRLRSAAAESHLKKQPTFNRSWLFQDGGRVTFVCAQLPDDMIGPFGNPENPNYTELQTYADIRRPNRVVRAHTC